MEIVAMVEVGLRWLLLHQKPENVKECDESVASRQNATWWR
jgi:hypothetical protein